MNARNVMRVGSPSAGAAPQRVTRRAGTAAAALTAALVVAPGVGTGSLAIADDVPPVIVHQPLDSVPAGGDAPLEARVTDDSGIADVRLRLRYPDSDVFEPSEMLPDDTDPSRFTGSIDTRSVEPGATIGYYITATDTLGNIESRGFDFDPFTVPVGEPVMTFQAPAEPAGSGNRTVLYVVGAAVAVGAIALLAGGTGEEDDEEIDVCCQITLGGAE